MKFSLAPGVRYMAYSCVWLLLALGGCQSTAPHAGQADLLSTEQYPRIVVARDLHKVLVFSDPIIEVPSESSPMKVTVPVRTKSNRGGAFVQYQYAFIDAHGRTLSSSGWRFQRLPPQWRRDLTAAALNTDAVDFRLEVIAAR